MGGSMTIDLTSTKTKLVLALLVVLAGAIGGLAAELMKTRKISGTDEDGGIELPKLLSRRYFDLGFPASLFLGVVAAAVAVWVFDLIQTVQQSGKSVDQYNIVRVVGVTLVAGLSAPKFLQTAQERLLAQMTAQRFENGLRTAGAANTAAQGTAPAPTPGTPLVAGGAPADAPAAGSAAAHATLVDAIVKETLKPGSVTGVPGS
jgi:H+/Cl- antiporter ClcA